MNGAFGRRSVLALAALTGLVSCARSAALRDARAGDWSSLRAAIEARERAADLSSGEAAAIARAVATRTLESATGAAAVSRVRETRSCARELDDALASAMERRDAAGALSVQARIDAGTLSADGARAWATDSDPLWRAAGARSLTREQDGDARAHALLDPSPDVRRAAARAARDARAPRDLPALFETARLDPEPMVRTEAVRAIAAEPAAADESVVDRLRDLWTQGDDGLREDIAMAYAQPSLWDAGGREALRRLVSSAHGPGAVDAAAATLRRATGQEDASLARDAAAALARAIGSGPRRERLQALAQAPLGPPSIVSAVETATRDEDVEVRVAALARMLERRAPQSESALEALSAPGSRVARSARFALALAGDRSVQAWLERDLHADAADDRLAAANALAAMRLPARAAPLLADVDPSVRMRAACIVLVAVRRTR